MDEKAAKDLVKTRKAVKQKYLALKSEISQKQVRMENEFKPITEPLQELIKTIKTEPQVKLEKYSPQLVSTPNTQFPFSTPKINKRKSNVYEKYLPLNMPSFIGDNDDVFLSYNDIAASRIDPSSQTITETPLQELRQDVLNLTKGPAYQEYLESYHPLVRGFVDGLIKDVDANYDHRYGLTHDVNTEKYQIGNSPVEFVGKDLLVGGVQYDGTVGLYELLFKKQPVGFKPKDLEEYMDILKRANVYRRNFDSTQQIQGTTDVKYLTIIKPYLLQQGILKGSVSQESEYRPISANLSQSVPKPTQRPRSTRLRSGKGVLLDFSRKKLDYVYYNDINELIERLKLLISSQMAGHTGHKNEIVSILEELREAKIIK